MTHSSGATLTFKGRIHPNRQTVRAILRKVQEEVNNSGTANNTKLTAEKRAKLRTTLRWASELLYNLGFDFEDVVRDLGDLAQIAELQRPAEPKVLGRPDARDRDVEARVSEEIELDEERILLP
jgi:hypothetical protein